MTARSRTVALAVAAVLAVAGLAGWWGARQDAPGGSGRPATRDAAPSTPSGAGYWEVAADGGVFSFGDAQFHGSMGGQHLDAPIVAVAPTPSGAGYWEVAADGGVFSFGDAQFHGSMGGQHLDAPIVAVAPTPSGAGYWEVAADGGVFSFGDAQFHGSMGGQHLDAPIVAVAPTPSGAGYWEVAADGGVFAFGDAQFHGSMGGQHLDAPIVAVASTPSGAGYWEVAADGGVFAFGDAQFHGSMGGQHLDAPIVAVASTPSGAGYWEVAADGGVFAFGDAQFHGSMGGQHLDAPIVAVASTPSGAGGVGGPGGTAAPGGSTIGRTGPTLPPQPPTLPTPTVTPGTPRTVCGNAGLLDGPVTPPAGAVVVHPGSTLPTVVEDHPGGTTFWLAPGTFFLGDTQFSQVIPAGGDTFVGAPGAIVDGQGVNDYAFTQQAPDVTVEYLTIEHFVSPRTQGVVNHDSGPGWVIAHDTVRTNSGAGVMVGDGDVLEDDCLTANGQYGFSAYRATGVSEVTVAGNEISYNDTTNWTSRTPGCGCAGGAKFWDTAGALVTDNYVHDNQDVGLWADTDNVGFDFAGNYISNNYAEGILYEISYNARIAHNTLERNAIGVGSATPSSVDGAIYVSESGSDPRVGTLYGATFAITDNRLMDNWSGVVLYENANRFCGSPYNSSSSSCTLVTPATFTPASCAAHLKGATPGGSPDYYDDCRWKTQNVLVSGNTLVLTRTAVGSDCTAARSCGLQALFSEFGSTPTWSPYQGSVVQTAVTWHQGNHFQDNSYHGSWTFVAFTQGPKLSFTTWQHTWDQDAGSTYAR